MARLQKFSLYAQTLLIALSTTSLADAPAETSFLKEEKTVLAVKISEAINEATVDHLNRALVQARIRGNPALLVELNSIGGFTTSIQDLVPLVLSSDIPIIIWITGDGAQSASSSIFLSLSAHLLAMHPGATIGELPQNKTLPESRMSRLEKDAFIYLKAIAKKRSRTTDWVKTFMREGTYFTANQAYEQNMIEGVVATREELWTLARAKIPHLPEAVTFVDFEKNPKEKFMKALSHPDVSFGLLALGAIGIYTELLKPGLLVPGGVGSLAIALGILTMSLIPIRPIAILIFGIGLLIISIEVLTPLITYGVAGFLGAACLFWAGFFLVDKTQSDLVLDANIWVPLFAALLLVVIFFTWQAIKNRKANPYGPGVVFLVKKHGIVKTVVSSGEAVIDIHGHLWSARWATPQASQEFVSGAEVIVTQQRGFTLYVETLK